MTAARRSHGGPAVPPDPLVALLADPDYPRTPRGSETWEQRRKRCRLSYSDRKLSRQTGREERVVCPHDPAYTLTCRGPNSGKTITLHACVDHTARMRASKSMNIESVVTYRGNR